MSVNKVILVGNLGKDPEAKTFDGGAKKATFSVATTFSFKNKEGEREKKTEWHNIVVWRGLAEVAEKYLKKGSQVYLEGRIESRSYEDKDGNKKYITEIICDQLVMLDKKKSDGSEEATPEEPSGDLPF